MKKIYNFYIDLLWHTEIRLFISSTDIWVTSSDTGSVVSRANVWVAKKDTKRSSVLLLHLVSFFATQTLELNLLA